MGLFDRLFSSGSDASKPTAGPQARKPAETKFLEADEASSLGDVNFMRRSNTIRRTFPGTADSPGDKEMVAEVASMEARLEKATQGLPGTEVADVSMNLTDGIPKPVKKTFAQQMSQAELDQRKKGSALGVNVPIVAASASKEKEEAAKAAGASSTSSGLNAAKPGAIDPFKQMVKDLNA
jgi:CheY-like chemotaxis protein